MGKVFSTQLVSKAWFIDSHPKVTAAAYGDNMNYTLGAMCGIKSAHRIFQQFEDMLSGIRLHFTETWGDGDPTVFDKAVQTTVVFRELEWFENASNEVRTQLVQHMADATMALMAVALLSG